MPYFQDYEIPKLHPLKVVSFCFVPFPAKQSVFFADKSVLARMYMIMYNFKLS